MSFFSVEAALSPIAQSGTPTFPNGYRYRRKIVVPTSNIDGTESRSNFEFVWNRTETWLKSTTNGGKVTSNNGYDIIFEQNGNMLAHYLDTYTPTTGYANIRVIIPLLSKTSNNEFYIYYGNPNVTTNQSNLAGFPDLRRYNLPTTTEAKGSGDNLTNSGVTSLVTDYGTVGNFEAGDTMYSSSGAFANPTNDFGIRFWAKTDIPHVGVIFGFHDNPAGSPDSGYSLMLKPSVLGSVSGQAHCLVMTYKDTAGTSYRYESKAELSDDKPHLYHISYDGGTDKISLYVDGVKYADKTTTDTFVADFSKSGRLNLGLLNWDGWIGQMSFYSREYVSERVVTEWRNWQNQTAFYGLGTEENPNATTGTVVIPKAFTNVTAAITFNPVEGVSGVNVSSVPTPSKGTVAVSGNSITYTPTQGEYGTDYVKVNLSNGEVVSARIELPEAPQVDAPYLGKGCGVAIDSYSQGEMRNSTGDAGWRFPVYKTGTVVGLVIEPRVGYHDTSQTCYFKFIVYPVASDGMPDYDATPRFTSNNYNFTDEMPLVQEQDTDNDRWYVALKPSTGFTVTAGETLWIVARKTDKNGNDYGYDKSEGWSAFNLNCIEQRKASTTTALQRTMNPWVTETYTCMSYGGFRHDRICGLALVYSDGVAHGCPITYSYTNLYPATIDSNTTYFRYKFRPLVKVKVNTIYAGFWYVASSDISNVAVRARLYLNPDNSPLFDVTLSGFPRYTGNYGTIGGTCSEIRCASPAPMWRRASATFTELTLEADTDYQIWFNRSSSTATINLMHMVNMYAEYPGMFYQVNDGYNIYDHLEVSTDSGANWSAFSFVRNSRTYDHLMPAVLLWKN